MAGSLITVGEPVKKNQYDKRGLKMSENNDAMESMSLSKQRKIQRKKDIEKQKRNKKIGRIVWLAVLALLALLACFCVFVIVRNMVTHVTMNGEYSKYLDANGHIEGVKATDYAILPDYKNISVNSHQHFLW